MSHKEKSRNHQETEFYETNLERVKRESKN